MQNVLFFTVVKLVWNARQDVVVVGHDVDEKLRPCTGDSCKQHEHEAALGSLHEPRLRGHCTARPEGRQASSAAHSHARALTRSP